MKKLTFHRIPESKLPACPFKTQTLLRIISIKHLNDFSFANLKLFKEKGCKCANPKCNREGHYITLSLADSGGVIANILSKDYMLMTKDHIIPTSKGGIDNMTNWQPMCNQCNLEKGSRHIGVTPTAQVIKFQARMEEYRRKTAEKLAKLVS